MTPENFVYWLNGFVELNGNPPTPEQWQSIKEHLQLVMTKVTPPILQVKYVPNDVDPYDYSEYLKQCIPKSPPAVIC